MSTTTATETVAPVVAAGPYTNRSNANRAMKRVDKHGLRDLFVSDNGTEGEEYFVMERVIDGATETPKSRTPIAQERFEQEQAARDAAEKVAPTEDEQAETALAAHEIPDGAVEVGKKVRCGAGTVTYTHRVKDGSRFVFGRWVAEDGTTVTFAAGRGWWKDGRKVDATTLAGSFEA